MAKYLLHPKHPLRTFIYILLALGLVVGGYLTFKASQMSTEGRSKAAPSARFVTLSTLVFDIPCKGDKFKYIKFSCSDGYIGLSHRPRCESRETLRNYASDFCANRSFYQTPTPTPTPMRSTPTPTPTLAPTATPRPTPTNVPANTPTPTKLRDGSACTTASQCQSGSCKYCPDIGSTCRPSNYICPI